MIVLIEMHVTKSNRQNKEMNKKASQASRARGHPGFMANLGYLITSKPTLSTEWGKKHSKWGADQTGTRTDIPHRQAL